MKLADQIKAAADTAGLAPTYHKPEAVKQAKAPEQASAAPPSSEDHRAFLEHQPPRRSEVPRVWEFPESDDGRAACFLEHFGHMLRYCPEIDRWRVWHGHRWHDDTTGRAGYFAQLLSRDEIFAAEEFARERDGDKKAEKLAQKFRRRAEALGNECTIKATLAAAARNPRIVVPLDQWDANPWMAGVQNGVLDLRTRQLHPGRPEDHMTRAMNAQYNPKAECPRWRQFIARVLPGDLGGYVQRIAGYSLSGSVDDAAFYFCHGSGKNGKSIMLGTLANLFGPYAGHARAELIEEPRNGSSPKNDLANLPGIRFLHSEETTDGAKFRAGTLKSLATGETLTGERKFKDPFEFKPQAKLWIGGNHRPRLDGADFGLTRRLRLIPFNVQISPEEEIPKEEFLAILRAETSGILNWLLEGLATWKPGLRNAPSEVREASAEYAKSEDELADFIDQCTQEAREGYRETTKKTAYDAYVRWSELEGNKHPLTSKTFTRRLVAKGWRLDSGRRYWRAKSIRREEDWGEREE